MSTFNPNPTPSFPAKATIKYAILETPFGDGYNQRLTDGMNPRVETWELVWQNLTDAEAAAILAFFDATFSIVPFQWTTPNGDTLNFVVKPYGKEKVDANVNNLTATFIQDHNSGL